jgi:hypothetical protein
VLGGRIIFRESRNGQWIAVIAIERAENARLSSLSEIVSLEECSRAAPEGAAISMAADPALR